VEALTVDIISSSLNGFSLSVFSGSGPPELDIFEVCKSLFLKINNPRAAKTFCRSLKEISEARREKSTSGGVLGSVRWSEASSETTYEFFSAACLGVFQDSVKRFLSSPSSKRSIDSSLFVRKQVRLGDQLIDQEFFKLFFSFGHLFLFFAPGLNLPAAPRRETKSRAS
jgi:hypothetical protein